jgi:hypothetical protein
MPLENSPPAIEKTERLALTYREAATSHGLRFGDSSNRQSESRQHWPLSPHSSRRTGSAAREVSPPEIERNRSPARMWCC